MEKTQTLNLTHEKISRLIAGIIYVVLFAVPCPGIPRSSPLGTLTG